MGWRQYTRERLTSADFQQYAVDQGNLAFPSAAARDAAIPVGERVEGMVSYLADVKAFEDCIGGAWRRRSGRVAVALSAGTTAAVSNTRLGLVTVDPGRPYRVTVHAAINTLPTADARAALRLFDQGSSLGATTVRAAESITFDSPDANPQRTFVVDGGEARTFEANLEVLAGSAQYFLDERHSFLEASWVAL